MSLIIKGMKLPENDGMKELVIGRAPNGTEPIAIVSGDTTEFYKIIEIPTPHGRLIGADAYIDKHEECGWLDDITVDEFNAITPTIIEAEVGKE